jgi:hypothetical protein
MVYFLYQSLCLVVVVVAQETVLNRVLRGPVVTFKTISAEAEEAEVAVYHGLTISQYYQVVLLLL